MQVIEEQSHLVVSGRPNPKPLPPFLIRDKLHKPHFSLEGSVLWEVVK